MKADVGGFCEVLSRDGKCIFVRIAKVKGPTFGATITDQRPFPKPTSTRTASDCNSFQGKISK
jgi:hypothetical protein